MADSRKRIGLIGLSAKGSWASHSHFGYLKQTSRYEIKALQNSSKASAAAAAKEYSLEQAATYDNPSALASDPNVDIVAVSVNVPQHYDLIKPALEAGKDVFSEWPLARNLAEAEELTQLAKKMGVRTMIGLQARQNPSIVKAKEIVASGKLGRILSTTMYGHGVIFGGVTTEDRLYLMSIENGANLVTIPFGHAVDALCYVLGEIKDLSATLANLYPELELVDGAGQPVKKVKKTAHDHVSLNAVLVEGGGHVDVTYAPGISRTGNDFHWQIVGTEGSLLLEGPRGGGHVQMSQPTVKLATNSEELKEVEVDKAPDPSYNVGKAWDAWAGVGLDKGYSITTFEDAVLRHKMLDAIYRSAASGKRENYL
ncbi:NAD-binding Rossmann fold oxidoreductase family protein [Plenodomus tracheiphilus IPT5]|uniref:NAD-binding Rossmann fold oxidoreductase family protein n=1 Tax=Plenodomus tracheiphilus IPT5 TaxID=1408161 RepID=A0A6A7B357_9PLEO|nr:NAD-binding Rossmann fold oxidoreductase family protein [Plenodomus tracheiphilus IPT5]